MPPPATPMPPASDLSDLLEETGDDSTDVAAVLLEHLGELGGGIGKAHGLHH